MAKTIANSEGGRGAGEGRPQEGFIRVIDRPNAKLSSADKAVLNRKANEAFNNGNIEAARRIYTATGYSDGLTRVGDRYMEKKRPLTALKQYILAHNSRKTSPMYGNIAQIISAMLSSDKGEQGAGESRPQEEY